MPLNEQQKLVARLYDAQKKGDEEHDRGLLLTLISLPIDVLRSLVAALLGSDDK